MLPKSVLTVRYQVRCLILELGVPQSPQLGQISAYLTPCKVVGFRFRQVSLFCSHKPSKATDVENPARILQFLTPENLEKVLAKCLSEFLKFNLGSNL